MGCANCDAVFGPAIAARVLQWFASPHRQAPAFPELTERQREVPELIARRVSNPAIAQRLGIGGKTVGNHVSNIFAKLHPQPAWSLPAVVVHPASSTRSRAVWSARLALRHLGG